MRLIFRYISLATTALAKSRRVVFQRTLNFAQVMIDVPVDLGVDWEFRANSRSFKLYNLSKLFTCLTAGNK
jgi:hypothetical protein